MRSRETDHHSPRGPDPYQHGQGKFSRERHGDHQSHSSGSNLSNSGKNRNLSDYHQTKEQNVESRTEENMTSADNYEGESLESQSWEEDSREGDDYRQDSHQPNPPPRYSTDNPPKESKEKYRHPSDRDLRAPNGNSRAPRHQTDSRSESRNSYSEPGASTGPLVAVSHGYTFYILSFIRLHVA